MSFNFSQGRPDAKRHDDPVDIFMASRSARLALQIILWLIVIGLITASIDNFRTRHQFNTPLTIPFTFLILFILVLITKGRLKTAFEIFLWGLIGNGIYSGLTVSGMQSPGMLMLPLACMLSGWLFGFRQAILILTAASIGIIVIGMLQAAGKLPAIPRSPATWAVVYITACATGMILGMAMTAGIREHYRKAVNLSTELTQLNAQLEAKVVNRTAELTAALDHLQQMQSDLLQSEKLSSLGSLVAGISHELNTPIGNVMLMSSKMLEQFMELDAFIKGSAIKRSDLIRWHDETAEMCQLINRSVHRAAELIASFKQVAVDQTSERRRSFNLRDTVEDVLFTLRPGLKLQPWIIENNIPTEIECDSFPGPLEQIITNLIQNAALHAFDTRTQGCISITATAKSGKLELIVADDGVGMDASTLAHVFEPFFTTKFGKGGSGLGLAVSYRIATTVLAGDLRAISAPEMGASFILSMPVSTPGKL